MTTLEILIVICTPIAAWLSYRAGELDGMVNMLTILETEGLLQVIEVTEEDEQDT
jgi:hypothetical protein